MKKTLITVLTAVLGMVMAAGTLADHHAAPRTSALEIYFCSFADGKDMSDLKKVAAGWDQWADTNFSEGYAAYILAPVIANGADFPFDSIWMGVAENHEAMGTVMDEWAAKGGAWQKKFDAASKCDSHALMTSVEAKPYAKLGQAGYLQISACEFKDSAGFADLMAADKKWTAWMDKNAMPGGIYRWIPGVGAPRGDSTDFYGVYVAESFGDRGKAHDMMMGGGFPVWSALYDGIAECDNPRVWNAQPAGGVAAK